MPPPPTPSQAFGNLCNAYTKAYNKRYHRTGSLFENPFGRKPVTNERYFTTLIRYIHQNLQRHGIVDDFRDWPYSSYDAIVYDKPTRVMKTAILDWFGGAAELEDSHQITADIELIAPYLGDNF